MKILAAGAICEDKDTIERIVKLGHEVMQIKDERIPLDVQNTDPSDFDGVICNGLFLYNDISLFKNLKYIQLTSAGLERVPADYIKQHNIALYNARGVFGIPMAEAALGGVLQLYKNSAFFYENQKRCAWEKDRNLRELYGKKVLIIGCGDIGTECAKRFSAFGCGIYGVDLIKKENPLFSEIFSPQKLQEIIGNFDVAVLTCPLTEETLHIINRDVLFKMKNGAILVNISRGPLVDTDALIAALEEKLSGAVLDVFETEPLPPNSPLWKMKNVIITPHNSFVGDGNRKRLSEVIIKNLTNYGNI